MKQNLLAIAKFKRQERAKAAPAPPVVAARAPCEHAFAIVSIYSHRTTRFYSINREYDDDLFSCKWKFSASYFCSKKFTVQFVFCGFWICEWVLSKEVSLFVWHVCIWKVWKGVIFLKKSYERFFSDFGR